MTKTKILKEVVWLVFFLFYFTLYAMVSPNWYGLIARIVSVPADLFFMGGIPALILAFISRRFLIAPDEYYYFFYIIFQVSFNYVLFRIFFSYVLGFKRKVFAGLLFLILFGLVNYGGRELATRISLEPNWHTYRYDDYHFSIELPYPAAAVWGKKSLLLFAEGNTLFDVRIYCYKFSDDEPIPTLERVKSLNEEKFGRDKVSFAVCDGFPAVSVLADNYSNLDVFNDNLCWTFIIENKNINEKYYPADIKQMNDRVINSIKLDRATYQNGVLGYR
jgi:hypothetical protein